MSLRNKYLPKPWFFRWVNEFFQNQFQSMSKACTKVSSQSGTCQSVIWKWYTSWDQWYGPYLFGQVMFHMKTVETWNFRWKVSFYVISHYNQCPVNRVLFKWKWHISWQQWYGPLSLWPKVTRITLKTYCFRFVSTH